LFGSYGIVRETSCNLEVLDCPRVIFGFGEHKKAVL
jgi:hypothetical protein